MINGDNFWIETCPHYIIQSHGSLKWNVICRAILKERLNARPLSFCDVKHCRLVAGYQRFGTAYPSRLQGLRRPSKCQELDMRLYRKQWTSFLSALQPWVSFGLLNNHSPSLSIFHLLHPLLYLHHFQVCYHIIHPSQKVSSFSSSYKLSSFHHLSWHRSHFHSFYTSHPSFSLSFYKFHNILPIYGSILHYF